MYHIGLQSLRAKIRGFQLTGETLRIRISKSEKERKFRLWNLKRALGVKARHHLIAYGLLRGIPYHQIEKCAENNKPNAKVVLDIMLEHNGVMPIRRYGDKLTGGGYQTYDLAKVENLLSTSGLDERTATSVAAAPASPAANNSKSHSTPEKTA